MTFWAAPADPDRWGPILVATPKIALARFHRAAEHPRRALQLVGDLLCSSEGHPTHLKFSAAWVPFPVLSAVLGAAIRRSLARKLLISLGLGFFFEPEGRGFESLPARH